MFLTSAAAKALAAITLGNLYGSAEVAARRPFVAQTSGAYIFVKGRSAPIAGTKEFRKGFSIVFDKTTAEIRDIETMAPGVMHVPKATLDVLRASGWRPRRKNELIPPPPRSASLDINEALFGGLINKPEAALAYAYVLIRAMPDLAKTPRQMLYVELRGDQAWHVMRGTPGTEVLRFSRVNGKVL